MKIKMLRNIGRNLLQLAPETEKVIAAALAAGKQFIEGRILDVKAAEAEFLKKHGLAEEVKEEAHEATSPAALAKKAAGAREPASPA